MVVGIGAVLIQQLPSGRFVAPWFPFFLALSAIITLGCVVGMWMMKRWSVYLYAGWVTLGIILGITLLGIFSLPALMVRVVVIAVSFYFICCGRNKHAERGAV
jgi:hypothetical protein